MLACRKPEKAISALIKLVAGQKGMTQEGMALAYNQIDAEDDTLMGSINEAFGSHPMLIRRIQQIRQYAASNQYKRLL
jgi:Zn-dependent protease with chaperone function